MGVDRSDGTQFARTGRARRPARSVTGCAGPSSPLTVRRDGADLRAAGSFPVAFSDWNIAQPKGYGLLGSLADHGTAEFLLVLTPA